MKFERNLLKDEKTSTMKKNGRLDRHGRLKIINGDGKQEWIDVCQDCYYGECLEIFYGGNSTQINDHKIKDHKTISKTISKTKKTKLLIPKIEPLTDDYVNRKIQQNVSAIHYKEKHFLSFVNDKNRETGLEMASVIRLNPLTGCFHYPYGKFYQFVMNLKEPKNPDKPLVLHSQICESQVDLSSGDTRHIHCCNPQHLRWGTQQENANDRKKRSENEKDPEFIKKCKKIIKSIFPIV